MGEGVCTYTHMHTQKDTDRHAHKHTHAHTLKFPIHLELVRFWNIKINFLTKMSIYGKWNFKKMKCCLLENFQFGGNFTNILLTFWYKSCFKTLLNAESDWDMFTWTPFRWTTKTFAKNRNWVILNCKIEIFWISKISIKPVWGCLGEGGVVLGVFALFAPLKQSFCKERWRSTLLDLGLKGAGDPCNSNVQWSGFVWFQSIFPIFTCQHIKLEMATAVKSSWVILNHVAGSLEFWVSINICLHFIFLSHGKATEISGNVLIPHHSNVA